MHVRPKIMQTFWEYTVLCLISDQLCGFTTQVIITLVTFFVSKVTLRVWRDDDIILN